MQNLGIDSHTQEYINSLKKEIIGSCETFKDLKKNVDYISIVNTMQYMSRYKISIKECKSEVFKMLSKLEHIENQIGGVSK